MTSEDVVTRRQASTRLPQQDERGKYCLLSSQLEDIGHTLANILRGFYPSIFPNRPIQNPYPRSLLKSVI